MENEIYAKYIKTKDNQTSLENELSIAVQGKLWEILDFSVSIKDEYTQVSYTVIDGGIKEFAMAIPHPTAIEKKRLPQIFAEMIARQITDGIANRKVVDRHI